VKSVFVGNVNLQITEGHLRALFEPFGEVARIEVIEDRETGRRGFAFVQMLDDHEAANAMANLDGKEVAGHTLRVNEGAPTVERSSKRRFSSGPGAR
jgi:RNA recognition motif-containing protein